MLYVYSGLAEHRIDQHIYFSGSLLCAARLRYVTGGTNAEEQSYSLLSYCYITPRCSVVMELTQDCSRSCHLLNSHLHNLRYFLSPSRLILRGTR